MRWPHVLPWNWSAVALLLLLLSGCDPLASPYSQQAYKNATDLKAQSLVLIAKSGEQYSRHAAEVEALRTEIEVAYEFSKGYPNNEVVTQQWANLKDPNRNLLGGHLRRWQEQGTINAFVRTESIEAIGEAFDTIICVEATKKDVSACSAQAQEANDGN